LLPVLTAGSELPRLAPSHRRSCAALLAFALVVLYVAVNFYSLDEEIIEFISSKPHAIYKSSALRHISLALTGILPVVVFAWGLRSRRRLFLYAGALMAVASLTTMIFYTHLASLWIVFSASGLALIAVAVLIQRWLDSGPGRVRRGFTAQVLFESPEKRSALELAGTVVTLTPQAAAPPEKGGSVEAAANLAAAAPRGHTSTAGSLASPRSKLSFKGFSRRVPSFLSWRSPSGRSALTAAGIAGPRIVRW
jgi:hypothetical protein